MELILYELSSGDDWLWKSSSLEIVLRAATSISMVEPSKVFQVAKNENGGSAWICTFQNGRLLESFLNAPEMSAEA